MNLRLWQWFTPLLLIVLGCATDNRPATKTEKGEASSQPVETAAPVKTTFATIAEVEELIAKQNGKVVVLDLWASW